LAQSGSFYISAIAEPSAGACGSFLEMQRVRQVTKLSQSRDLCVLDRLQKAVCAILVAQIGQNRAGNHDDEVGTARAKFCAKTQRARFQSLFDQFSLKLY
jgi:hypothetical protein